MRSLHHHRERHLVRRIGWLRAAAKGNVLLAGTAGPVAGAMSIAAGEYVSVSSQSDTEHADLTRERAELKADPAGEEEELAAIYVKRGLDPDLANGWRAN